MGAPSITAQFRSIFEGYTAGYVKHTPPFKRDDNGKLKASWVGVAKYKRNDRNNPSPPPGFEVDDQVPLTEEQYRDHLNGVQGLAVSPLFDLALPGKPIQNNVCLFGVIDIDTYGVGYTELVHRLYQLEYRFAAFVSKSGGLHIYFFFRKAESAAQVRVELKRIVEVFGLHKTYSVAGVSRVEVFPEHDTRKPGQWDKCVFLPFYDSKHGSEQLMITATGELQPIHTALPMIEGMYTSVSEIAGVTDGLPYADAPFCIQMLLLSGGPATNYNDFLFTAAIYAKTKYGEAFSQKHIEEMNDHCTDPIDNVHVKSMFTSVVGTDWSLRGRCKKEPVCTVCDKELCKLRVYGVGRDKRNTTSNVEFGKIYRMMAETPYYLWEARLTGTEEWRKLRIDGSENLLNQKTVQKACIDTLGQLSLTVSPPIWEKRVNDCLLTIENVEVPKATDTTEMSALRDAFERYLTHGQARNTQPQTVFTKQVYRADGVFYFRTDGFVDYLRVVKFVLGRTNLREQLIQYGCVEGEVTYTNGAGEKKSIPCWKKVEDEHLRSLGTYYEDVMASDADLLTKNPLNKEDKTVSNAGEDQRF